MEEKYKEKTSYSGPISLVSEVGHWKYVQEKDAIEENMEDAEKLMINYDGEAVAYYSNNNQAKKFYKKLVLGTFKGKKNNQRSFSGSNKNVQTTKSNDSFGNLIFYLEFVTEKKLVDDSGYDCNYRNGKNHLARDCTLKKKDRKK